MIPDKIFQDLRQSTLLESAPESVVNKLAEIVVTTSIIHNGNP